MMIVSSHGQGKCAFIWPFVSDVFYIVIIEKDITIIYN